MVVPKTLVVVLAAGFFVGEGVGVGVGVGERSGEGVIDSTVETLGFALLICC